MRARIDHSLARVPQPHHDRGTLTPTTTLTIISLHFSWSVSAVGSVASNAGNIFVLFLSLVPAEVAQLERRCPQKRHSPIHLSEAFFRFVQIADCWFRYHTHNTQHQEIGHPSAHNLFDKLVRIGLQRNTILSLSVNKQSSTHKSI